MTLPKQQQGQPWSIKAYRGVKDTNLETLTACIKSSLKLVWDQRIISRSLYKSCQIIDAVHYIKIALWAMHHAMESFFQGFHV